MTVVGIAGMGVMGSAVGARLVAGGATVITATAGRSVATRERALKAGIVDVETIESLVRRADIVMSIMGSTSAVEFAADFERAVKAAGRRELIFVECNLIDPQVVRLLEDSLDGLGVAVIDAGIVGPPPGEGHGPSIYLSGAASDDLLFLRDHGFVVEIVSARTGDASALKLCSAAVWQGCLALITEVAVAAEGFGVRGPWLGDLYAHQAALASWFLHALVDAPERAERWMGDMSVISRALGDAGADERYHAAAAMLYGRMARLPSVGWGDATEILDALEGSEA